MQLKVSLKLPGDKERNTLGRANTASMVYPLRVVDAFIFRTNLSLLSCLISFLVAKMPLVPAAVNIPLTVRGQNWWQWIFCMHYA